MTRVKRLQIPVGTVKRCRIDSVFRGRETLVLGCKLEGDAVGESTLLVYQLGQVDAQVGDRGTVTFTAGGPMGGYWLFAKNDPEGPTS